MRRRLTSIAFCSALVLAGIRRRFHLQAQCQAGLPPSRLLPAAPSDTAKLRAQYEQWRKSSRRGQVGPEDTQGRPT